MCGPSTIAGHHLACNNVTVLQPLRLSRTVTWALDLERGNCGIAYLSYSDPWARRPSTLHIILYLVAPTASTDPDLVNTAEGYSRQFYLLQKKKLSHLVERRRKSLLCNSLCFGFGFLELAQYLSNTNVQILYPNDLTLSAGSTVSNMKRSCMYKRL